MAFLIDSDVAIDHLADDEAAVRLLRRLAPDGLGISAITYVEVYEGIVRAVTSRAEDKFKSFLAGIEVVPFTTPEAIRCAQLREQLRRQGRPVRARALDLLIAATAIEHDLTLLTRNTADYRDIPGLKLHPGP